MVPCLSLVLSVLAQPGTPTYRWQYAAVGELDGDAVTPRVARLEAPSPLFLLATDGALQLDGTTWSRAGSQAGVLRAEACLLSSENSGVTVSALRLADGTIWALTSAGVQRRLADGAWAAVAAATGSAFWVNSATDIWVFAGLSVTHFDGQTSATEALPVTLPRGLDTVRIWAAPNGEAWVVLTFYDDATQRVGSKVLRRSPNGWVVVSTGTELALGTFGVGTSAWITGERGAVWRWDGSNLVREATGSSARLLDGAEREDGSVVVVGEKGGVLLRSEAGAWRQLPVNTLAHFVTVSPAAGGRMVLGIDGVDCLRADDVCPTRPPTDQEPSTGPTLSADCRVPRPGSTGCGCESLPGSAALLLVAAAWGLGRKTKRGPAV